MEKKEDIPISRHFTLKKYKDGEKYLYLLSLNSKKIENSIVLSVKVTDANYDTPEECEAFENSYSLKELKDLNNKFFGSYTKINDSLNGFCSIFNRNYRFSFEKKNKIFASFLVKIGTQNEINFILTKKNVTQKEITNVLLYLLKEQEETNNLLEERNKLYEKRLNQMEKELSELKKKINNTDPKPNSEYDAHKNNDFDDPLNYPSAEENNSIRKTDFDLANNEGNDQTIANEKNQNYNNYTNNPSLEKSNINPRPNDPFQTKPHNFIIKKSSINTLSNIKCKQFTIFNDKKSSAPILIYSYEETDGYLGISINNLNLKDGGGEEGQKISKIHKGEINCFRYYEEKNLLLTSSCDNFVKIIDIENQKIIYSNKIVDVLEACLLLSNEVMKKNYLITSKANNDPMELWAYEELSSEPLEAEAKIDSSSPIYFLDTYINKGKVYIIYGSSNKIQSFIYECPKKNIWSKAKTFQGEEEGNCLFRSVKILDDGQEGGTKILGGTESKIIIWNFDNEKSISTFDFEENILNICIWNEKYLIVSSKDSSYLGYIKIIKISKGGMEIREEKQLDNDKEIIPMNIIKFVHHIFAESFMVNDKDGNLYIWSQP